MRRRMLVGDACSRARIMRSGISRGVSLCYCWAEGMHDGSHRKIGSSESSIISRGNTDAKLHHALGSCSMLNAPSPPFSRGPCLSSSQDSKPDSGVRRLGTRRLSKEGQARRGSEAPWDRPGSASSVVLVPCPCSSSLRTVVARTASGKLQLAGRRRSRRNGRQRES